MALEEKDTGIFSLSMIQQVIEYIENNLLEKLTPAAVASHFFISESVLSSLFKIVCNMTIMEYIRNRRLTLAAAELVESNIPIIELAYKYGYETPEAFTKAFSRCFCLPPSFIRRGFSVTKFFLPMEIEVAVRGGWETTGLTKANAVRQDQRSPADYTTLITDKGGNDMENQKFKYQINTSTMQYKREWSILCSLAEKLLRSRILFKVDGKTMIFAHGLEIPLKRICLTFKWKDEAVVKAFFHTDTEVKHAGDGFKFFDVTYEGMEIRCMFYGDCPGDDTDEFLYKNTDCVQVDNLSVPVQSLEFYYENAGESSEYYKMVEEWLQRQKRVQ